MEVKLIEYQGKDVLYVDHRGAKHEQEMLQLLHKGVEIEKTLDEGSLLLANFENVFLSYNFMEEVKRSGELRSKIMKKTAVVGMSGFKFYLLNTYIKFTGQKKIKTFDTEKAALDWLVL